jgi:uncharacterized protein involved in type VI secretion and phage assembly
MSLLSGLEDLCGKKGERMTGVAVGIVTNNQDPEGLGRVKVKFPWRDSTDESPWARVATLMAGNRMGSFCLPEVNDEVLVAFEHGDIAFPVVLGSLWNGKDKPPETNSDGHNNIRKFRSRSGHEIVFNDEESKENIVIQSKAGHTVKLDDTAGQEKIEIQDKTGSNKVVIDSVQNTMEITCGMQLKIKANMVEISADSTMTIKAGATLTIQGTLVQIN